MSKPGYRSFIDCSDYGRLYGVAYPVNWPHYTPGWICSARELKQAVIIKGAKLLVPAFQLRKFGQAFINPRDLEIDLTGLETGTYRIVAVHNFQAEDNNPNLDECLAGIFIAALHPDGQWEEPEYYPFECRTLEILGYFSIPIPGNKLSYSGT